MSENIIIAGAGHAAGQVVASLKQMKYTGNITLVGEEPWYPYQRPPLSKKFLAGELEAARLYVKPESFYADANVSVLLDTRVDTIDRDNKTVTTSSGKELPYDILVLALGAEPRRIDLPGAELAGVCYLRTIADVDELRKQVQPGCKLSIVGAGYIGLEVAAVASNLGAKVTVIEMLDRVMSRVVSPEISAFYDAEHRQHGVEILLNTAIGGFSGSKHIEAVEIEGGQRIETNLVLIGIGVLPNTRVAAQAGLEIANGIVVDDRCRTSDAAIYAVGDCTFHPNALLGTKLRLESVHNALEQAKTAASNICGKELRYAQIPWFWSDQYDLKLQIVGISAGYDQVIIRGDMAGRSFSCLYLREHVLIAVDAVNRPRDFVQAKALIADKAVIDPEVLKNPVIAFRDMEYAAGD
jgi:3-phenylpropionate/trans-cinnamate dioxygenase ferredoxin reductase subunit